MYTAYHNSLGKFEGVIRSSDNTTIPENPEHRYWRKFLEWDAQQAQPLDRSDKTPDAPTKDEQDRATDVATKETLKAKYEANGDLDAADQKAVLLAILRSG